MSNKTVAERITELEELRALTVAALKKALKAQAYSIGGRSKQMASITELRAQIKDYDRQICQLKQGGIKICYGTPEC